MVLNTAAGTFDDQVLWQVGALQNCAVEIVDLNIADDGWQAWVADLISTSIFDSCALRHRDADGFAGRIQPVFASLRANLIVGLRRET